MKKFLYPCLFLAFIFTSCGGDDYVPATSDTQKPTAPLNVIFSNITETSVQLSWDASTDNVGVTGYNVYEGGVIVGGGSATNAMISNLSPNTDYTFFVTAEDAAGNESGSSSPVNITTNSTPLEFLPLLSDMDLFEDMANLTPEDGVQLYEINSTLFTDYATKPRFIKMPEGAAMRYNNSDLLPEFPDNTLIAKTFYYNLDDRDPSLGKRIIETRLLLKTDGSWQATNYRWNAAQTEAVRDDSGATLPISYIDINGDTQNVDYQIPSNGQCFECHNNNNETFPIGMKLRNMNFVPSYTGQNQLQYFTNNNLLLGVPDPTSISVLPDWEDDITYSLDDRARAYMDINCAHCHSPGGSVPPTFELDFRFETPFNDSGIYANRGEIEARFASTTPLYRMPLLGRTVVHEDALTMLTEYVDSLD